jgi:hypothetical protein
MTRRATRPAVAALAALALAALPRGAAAQASALITATADVNTTALAISNQVNLTFGTVVAGVPTTIDPKTSASAGFFVIQGAKNAEISVTFTLPTELRAGAGPHTIPLSFGAQGACARPQNNQATCTYFDPSVGVVDRIRNQNPPNNHFHVWLGGTVSPSPTQFGGVYTATVTMSVSYTGN